jgi:hypothetical protein
MTLAPHSHPPSSRTFDKSYSLPASLEISL